MLYLIRGLPGAGKTTLAKQLSRWVYEADDFFEDRDFDPSLLAQAHKECYKRTMFALTYGAASVAVSNTFTREKELEPYIALAKELKVPYTVIIVENRHGNKSIHDVPDSTVEKMRRRFSVRL